jgi:tetratricopeptide (TPR) repeat protein
MKKSLFVISALIFASSLMSGQSAPRNIAADLWSDPEFRKSFTASYGVLSDYEPEISDAEKKALRGLLEIIKNDPRSAIVVLEEQIKPGTSAAFDFILANLYFQQSDLQQAEQSYRKAVRKYPNFRRAHKNLSYVLVQTNQHPAAIDAISKSIELGVVDGRSYGLLGFCYLTEQLYYSAEAAYRQAILMQPRNRDWKMGLARCLVESENYPAAITLFDTLIKQEPDNADFWLLQANAYIGLEDPTAAAENIEIVHRMGHADVPALTMLGDIYMNQGSPSLALRAYLHALEKSDKQNRQALMRAAKLFTQTGSMEEATVLIDQIRATAGAGLSDEDELQLLTFEAKIARFDGNDAKAFEILKKIVERDALNGDALIELGNYYADRGDFDRATNRYEQAQQIARYERPAMIAHAQALLRNKNYDKALILLKRAIQLQEDAYLVQYIERIERAIQ